METESGGGNYLIRLILCAAPKPIKVMPIKITITAGKIDLSFSYMFLKNRYRPAPQNKIPAP